MKLERSVEQWQNCVPKVIAAGSTAQVEIALRDARHDILAMAAALTKIAEATGPRPSGSWTDEQAADHYWAAFDRCREIARAALRIASSDRAKPQP
jgi:hypothetical protein